MNRKLRVLIVEDEDPIRSGLTDVFVFHGYEVEALADGHQGLKRALGGRFDLVLLDVMLPGCDGFEICRRIRNRDREQPIIMLTAKGAEEDVIHGLSLGADDYVAKPFSVSELVLRAQAVLRRSGAARELEQRFRLGALEVDGLNLSARRGEEEVQFTRREMEVLLYLRAHGERPVSREELLARVWGYARQAELETRTVDIHIAKLRRKVEPDPGTPRHLITVRGAGYRLRSDP